MRSQQSCLLLLTLLPSFAVTDEECCQKLLIEGTSNPDQFYQDMMGVFTIYQDLPWIRYKDKGPAKFPVYTHNFTQFSDELKHPPRVFLYYYYNEIPQYPETQCQKGCWIISMYDAMPGNYWFGKKWFYIKNKEDPPCPDHLTASVDKRFIDQNGDLDPGLTIRCLDNAKDEL